jgi:hypothetical protein
LSVSGTFDQATYNATSRFQNQYFGDILEPWGHTGPTGFVYILTKKKINEIYCNTIISLTPDQQAEIIVFRSYLASIGGDQRGSGFARGNGGTVGGAPGFSVGTTSSTSTIAGGSGTTSTSSTGILMSTAKKIKDRLASAFGFMNGNAAVSLLAFPGSMKEVLRNGLQLLGILALIYAITSLLFNDESSRRNKLWFAAGLTLLALILVTLFASYYLVLPLVIVLIILVSMLIFSNKDGGSGTIDKSGTPIILPPASDSGRDIKQVKKNEKLESQIEDAVKEELSNQPSDSR